MPKIALYNILGSQIGELELNDEIFGVEPNMQVLHEVIKAQLANKRQGTQSALTRAEVSGGGIKPWKQKGTGRARQGSTRSPQWRHGGVVFAPKPRDYRINVNKKVKRLALKSALSSKILDNDFVVLDSFVIEPKTKEMVKVLKAFEAKKALIVLEDSCENVIRAAGNIPGVETTLASTLNAYDILKYDKFIVTKAAVAKIEEVYA